MNQPRRTLAEAVQPSALPPEAFAFIAEGTPKPQARIPVLATAKPVESREASTAAPATLKPAAEPQQAPKPRAPKETTVDVGPLVSMNCRLPAAIPAALLKASSERKLKKIRPFTQQDIIADALAAWLCKSGYME